MRLKSAVQKINRAGILLVFPIRNQEEPRSLWSELLPNKEMRWEWDDEGDNLVFEMWHLMKELSGRRDVVYSKWYQGRATFFSRDLFQAMLQTMRAQSGWESSLSRTAKRILEILENESPLSTKEIKRAAELQGKWNEGDYSRAMKELYNRLLIVACGEVDDGAFPSLSVGATKWIFEDLWLARNPEAEKIIARYLPGGSKTRKHFDRVLASLS